MNKEIQRRQQLVESTQEDCAVTGSGRKREKHIAMPESQKHARGTAETTTRHAMTRSKAPKRQAARAVIKHGKRKLDVESGKRPAVIDIKLQQFALGVACEGRETPRHRLQGKGK